MIDLMEMREKLLLDQLELAEKISKESDEKKKESLTFAIMRCFFRIEFIDELAQASEANLN